jgi:formamidopyrimidine-DNA glycosylase
LVLLDLVFIDLSVFLSMPAPPKWPKTQPTSGRQVLSRHAVSRNPSPYAARSTIVMFNARIRGIFAALLHVAAFLLARSVFSGAVRVFRSPDRQKPRGPLPSAPESGIWSLKAAGLALEVTWNDKHGQKLTPKGEGLSLRLYTQNYAMPELPEVETIAAGVDRKIRGDTIGSVWFSHYKEPFKTPPDTMAAALTGLRIARVDRVGKHIVFDLAAKSGQAAGKSKAAVTLQWLVHLGMTGQLLVSSAAVPVPKHAHAVLRLTSGRELRFVDARRFGRLALHAIDAGSFTGPGSEPLTISAADFAALFHGRKLSIKAALLNQSLLQGVGNIYADESLFRARIRPTRAAGQLSRERLNLLHGALRTVLKAAIRAGGSSVSDYVDADGVRGLFQVQHQVYGRESQPCSVCGTPIRRIVLAGRGTHFCPHCQK